MQIKKLSVFQFRNILHQNLEFHTPVTIFVGDNGQGKTNFVESIYYLSRGKSFRTSDTDPLIFNQAENKAVRIQVEIEKQETLHRLEAQIINDKKNFFLNEKRNNSLKIFKNFPVILFSPESLSIIKDGPELRRLLVDELVVLKEEQNIQVIADFKKALKSRNVLLKKLKTGTTRESVIRDVLEPLDKVFAKHGAELVKHRCKVISEIQHTFQQIVQEITQLNVNSYVDYVDGKGIKISSLYDESFIVDQLREKQALDFKIGTTQAGPHKHDLAFFFDNKESRYYCSQGQQRALILAFKLTQILYHDAIYGYYPILILDDVLSELDKDKRAYLIRFLSKNKAQTFLTTTDVEQHPELHNLDLKQFKVQKGSVVKG